MYKTNIILFFIFLALTSCIQKTNEAKLYTDLAEKEVKKMIKKQSSGLLKMEGFELLEAETVKSKKQKIFKRNVPASKTHQYTFKTTLIVTEDCYKDLTHFKGQAKNLFYNLRAYPLDKPCLICKQTERLFKGDKFETTCTFKFRKHENMNEAFPVKVKNRQYKKIHDGAERKNFKGELIKKR